MWHCAYLWLVGQLLYKKKTKKKNTCLHYIVEKIIQYIYVMLQGVKFKHGITFGAVAIIYP